MRDTPHLALAICHDIIAFALPGRGRAHALFAEIDVAVEFADDQQVDRRRDLWTQRGAVFEPRKQLRGAQVGEQPQFGAQAQNRLFGPQMALDRIEARIADRAEKNGIGRLRLCQRFGRQRVAARFIGCAADQRAVERHRQRQRVQHLPGLRHDFGTDAVAGQQQDLQCFAFPSGSGRSP